MCVNCQNSNEETLKSFKWYFSPKLYKDIKECNFCFQIEEERIHEHVGNYNWQYDRGNYRDVLKCKICGMILQERSHIIGFHDEKDALENWLTTDTTSEVQKEEKVYTRGRYLKNA